MSTNIKTLIALFSGTLAGAAVAIYFARAKGAIIKEKISNFSENSAEAIREKSQDAMSDFKEKVYQKVNNGRNGTVYEKMKKNRYHS